MVNAIRGALAQWVLVVRLLLTTIVLRSTLRLTRVLGRPLFEPLPPPGTARIRLASIVVRLWLHQALLGWSIVLVNKIDTETPKPQKNSSDPAE